MNKGSKTILSMVAVIGGLILLSWLASGIFMGIMGQGILNAKPYSIFQFAIQYNSDKRVQNALFLTVIIIIAIVFIIVALIVKSNKEKLFGDAKLATLADAKKAGMISGVGILLGKFKGEFLTLAGELFVLVAAPTRSGKGVGLVIPNLLNWSDSAVVLDVKFENYEITSGFRKKHGQDVFLFNPAPRDYITHRYNPLGYISNDPNHCIDDVQKIANFLLPTPKTGDPMWSSEARDLLFGIVMYLIEVKEFPITFGEVLRQLKTEKETATYFADEIASRKDKLSSPCIAALSNFINKPPKERSGVKSTLTSALNLWSNPLIDAATSENDFDLRDLRKRKMTIYIGVTPDNLARLAPLINLFVQQLIDLNTQDLPPQYDKKERLIRGNPAIKHQVLLLLDEFTAIGRIEILEKAIGFVAGYGIRLMTIIQSLSQLRSTYGPEVADTFIKNHAAQVIFRPEKMKEAEEIANELGFKTVKQISVTTPRYFGSGSGTKSRSETKRQLLLPQEVRELGDKEAIVLASGLRPIRAEKIRYYEDQSFMSRILKKVKIPIISTGAEIMRGESTELDLSRIYKQVPIPEHTGRELTDQEIDRAADMFFDKLVESKDTIA